VVAHLVRLKLSLLRNIFRRSRAQAIGAVVGILYFGFLVVGLAIIAASYRTSLADARVAIPLAGAAGTLLWILLPLFSFGSDPTLDASRFATFAVPPRTLAVGLIAAALVGLPAIATLVLACGVVFAWSHTVASTVVAVVATAIGVLTAITSSRWVSAHATNAVSTRRGRDVVAVVGLLLLVLIGPAVAAIASLGESQAQLAATAARVISWTPLGWAWAAPGDVADGDWLVGMVRLALAAGLLVLVGWAWDRVLRGQVENPRAVSRSDSGTAAAGDLGLFERFPDTPTGSIAARVSTYWRRDPRYQISLLMTPLLPLALLIPFFVGDVAWTPLIMGPVIAFFLGFSEHNAVAYEGDAFWLHVASGTSGEADRRGRLVPDLVIAAVLLPLYTVAGVWIGDRWDLLPGLVGLSVALLGAGHALSSVMSVVMPYPVPASGESPFSAPPGAAGVTMLAQTLASLGTVLLASPVIALGWFAWQGTTWLVWPAGLLGLVLGAVFATVGIRAGARIYDRRAPELLAALQKG
jgi:ABC-2 type transport system permease protein